MNIKERILEKASSANICGQEVFNALS